MRKNADNTKMNGIRRSQVLKINEFIIKVSGIARKYYFKYRTNLIKMHIYKMQNKKCILF